MILALPILTATIRLLDAKIVVVTPKVSIKEICNVIPSTANVNVNTTSSVENVNAALSATGYIKFLCHQKTIQNLFDIDTLN